MSEHEIVLVTTRTASLRVAEQIADAVVQRRAAAASHLLTPGVSAYWWQGSLHYREEYSVEAVTIPERAGEVMGIIRELHDYALPPILTTIAAADETYLEWVRAETNPVQ